MMLRLRKWLFNFMVRKCIPPVRIDKQLIKARVRDNELLYSVQLSYWRTGISVSCWYGVVQQHDYFHYGDNLIDAIKDLQLLQTFVVEIK